MNQPKVLDPVADVAGCELTIHCDRSDHTTAAGSNRGEDEDKARAREREAERIKAAHAERDAVVPLPNSAASTALVLSAENTYTSMLTGRVFKCGKAPDAGGGSGFGMLDTGCVLWSGAKALARLIECDSCGLAAFADAAVLAATGIPKPVVSVVELGAGFGVPGVVAAAVGAQGSRATIKVQLTDIDNATTMQRASGTITRNCSAEEQRTISVSPFDWEERPFPTDLALKDVHLFLAADTVYEHTWKPFLALVPELLGTSATQAEVWVVYVYALFFCDTRFFYAHLRLPRARARWFGWKESVALMQSHSPALPIVWLLSGCRATKWVPTRSGIRRLAHGVTVLFVNMMPSIHTSLF